MRLKRCLTWAIAILAVLLLEPAPQSPVGVPKAQAKVGHPLTPVSVAGVSRRTARRTTRRVAYRNSIAGCSPYRAYYNCGGVYYAPTVQDGVTVYVVVNP